MVSNNYSPRSFSEQGPLLPLFFFILFQLTFSFCESTVMVGEMKFDSMTAAFGMPWNNNVEYTAHLQYLDTHPFLCKDEEGVLSMSHPTRNLKHHHNKTSTIHIVSDDLKVALLVSRGACSFEEKARTALAMGNVDYVIVYDDRSRAHLVPMSATDPSGIDIGLIFVSHATGMQLRQMIDEESDNATQSGGLVISMDSQIPNDAYGTFDYNETQEWMLAAMSGFFAFMACVGCLLVCVQAGYIPADGRLVPFGQTAERTLLTEDQVARMPLIEFNPGYNETSCAICIEEYEPGEKLRQLPCGHIFHQDCLIPWLTERHASCPLCKYDLSVPEEGEMEESTNSNTWFWRSYGSLARILLHHDRQLLINEEENEDVETAEEASSNR